MSDTAGAKKKANPALIAMIVIVSLAVVLIIISLIILFVVGKKPELADKRNQILGAGATLTLAVLGAIIVGILGLVVINNRSKGNDARGPSIATTVIGIMTIILLIVSLVLSFVTANQINSQHADDARSLQAAGAMGLIGLVLLLVGFILFVANAYKKLPKPERKTRRAEFFRTRKRAGTDQLSDGSSMDTILSSDERQGLINSLRNLNFEE